MAPYVSDAEILAALAASKRHSTHAAAARELGININTYKNRRKIALRRGLTLPDGDMAPVTPEPPKRVPLPSIPAVPVRDSGSVWVFTSAQDDTDVHTPFLENLRAYAAHREAQIHIGGFTYQKGLFEDHSVDAGVFRPEIMQHLSPAKIAISKGVIWFGHINVLPTTARPLSGWSTQAEGATGIIPHARIALETIPVMPDHRPPQMMTTGAVTVQNYVQRAAGQKAEFHHTIGAVVLEVAKDGAHWCRHINATSDGSFQDLNLIVKDGHVSQGHSIEALNPGDLHADHMVDEWARLCLGYALRDTVPTDGSMMAALRPDVWFAHDSFTFKPRSHHNIRDPHLQAAMHHGGQERVEDEIKAVSAWLTRVAAMGPKCVHVASNHNMHLDIWLKDKSAHIDPPNARYWHEMNTAWHRAIEQGHGDDFLIHEFALRKASINGLDGVHFLREGDSYVICQTSNPVECGLHSHIGPRGARGSATNLARVPMRMNIGHGHGSMIKEGVYMSGTLGAPERWSSKGPGDWLPSHIVTYASGKRTLVTQWSDGRWRLGA